MKAKKGRTFSILSLYLARTQFPSHSPLFSFFHSFNLHTSFQIIYPGIKDASPSPDSKGIEEESNSKTPVTLPIGEHKKVPFSFP